mmetsp:Transcript_606/g.406  ORF Transcript_606/g.406 Transcript_606/m.406 type:complete len:137 (+) Transcript_606:69-479(+)
MGDSDPCQHQTAPELCAQASTRCREGAHDRLRHHLLLLLAPRIVNEELLHRVAHGCARAARGPCAVHALGGHPLVRHLHLHLWLVHHRHGGLRLHVRHVFRREGSAFTGSASRQRGLASTRGVEMGERLSQNGYGT